MCMYVAEHSDDIFLVCSVKGTSLDRQLHFVLYACLLVCMCVCMFVCG